jgi:hypothetical protein
MEFTYKAYNDLLNCLEKNNYIFADYYSWKNKEKVVIVRHDVDYDIDKAVELAKLEYGRGIRATYFVLLTSDLYNVLSEKNRNNIIEIFKFGHSIGLHFDEKNYPNLVGDTSRVKEKIKEELSILSKILQIPISAVSYHRPSKKIIESNLYIENVVNSYGNTFFHDFKYISDSRRNWREPVEEIIASNSYEKLHILTHPFWYMDEEKTLKETVRDFISLGTEKRFELMKNNFTDLETVITLKECRR